MTVTNSKIGFRKFPLSLKLAVVWVFLVSVNSFYVSLKEYNFTHGIEVGSFLVGIIFLWSAIGLIQVDNGYRRWTIFWLICYTLAGLGFLIYSISTYGDISFHLNFATKQYPVEKPYGILVFAFVFLINIAVSLILLRPSTKALFSRESPHPIPPPETTPQEPA